MSLKSPDFQPPLGNMGTGYLTAFLLLLLFFLSSVSFVFSFSSIANTSAAVTVPQFGFMTRVCHLSLQFVSILLLFIQNPDVNVEKPTTRMRPWLLLISWVTLFFLCLSYVFDILPCLPKNAPEQSTLCLYFNFPSTRKWVQGWASKFPGLRDVSVTLTNPYFLHSTIPS